VAGRRYEVVVLDDGFCWQGTHYRSLSRCANDHRHGVVGALFFGLKQNRSLSRCSPQAWGGLLATFRRKNSRPKPLI